MISVDFCFIKSLKVSLFLVSLLEFHSIDLSSINSDQKTNSFVNGTNILTTAFQLKSFHGYNKQKQLSQQWQHICKGNHCKRTTTANSNNGTFIKHKLK